MAVSGDGRIVLVVEDEPLVRMLAVDMLEEAGFQTVEAASAADAISVLETRSDIRLVFTDIDMPGSLDGMQLAACIRDRWPPIEIVITSGHLRPAADQLPPRSIFLPKPYSGRQLSCAMERLAA